MNEEEEYVKDVEERLQRLERDERITGVAIGLLFVAVVWLWLG